MKVKVVSETPTTVKTATGYMYRKSDMPEDKILLPPECRRKNGKTRKASAFWRSHKKYQKKVIELISDHDFEQQQQKKGRGVL